jgi:hypothetical protein
METRKIENEQLRSLTKNEEKAIDRYDLPLEVKAVISKHWQAQEQPTVAKSSWGVKVFGWFGAVLLFSILSFLLPIVLVGEYLQAAGVEVCWMANVALVVAIHRIGFGVLGLLIVLYFLGGFLLAIYCSILKDPLEKTALDVCCKKKTLLNRVSSFFNVLLLVALVLTGHYVVMVFCLLGVLFFFVMKGVGKRRIKQAIIDYEKSGHSSTNSRESAKTLFQQRLKKYQEELAQQKEDLEHQKEERKHWN